MNNFDYEKVKIENNKFNLKEITLMRVGYYGYQLVGFLAILKENLVLSILYLLFIIGGSFLVFYCLCTHCPHQFMHGKCTFVPFGLQKKLFKFKPRKMNVFEIIGHNLITKGAIIIPQFWLYKDLKLLIIFWILCLPTILRLSFYHCKKCQNYGCPFCSNKINI